MSVVPIVRSFEHHVLEQMRHARDSGTFVDGSHMRDPTGSDVGIPFLGTIKSLSPFGRIYSWTGTCCA